MLLSRGFARISLLLIAIAACLPLAGCLGARATRVHVPIQESAAKQYAYAVEFRDQANLPLITKPDQLEIARETVRQTFNMVPQHFPQDQRFTPLARLEVAEMDAGLDHRRAAVNERGLRRSIESLAALAAAYPDDDFIQAKTLYDRGLVHKRLGEFSRAQELFRQVRDTYLKNSNESIANIADRAAAYYNEVYINE